MPPPKYRNKEACRRARYHLADFHPVPDRRGISMINLFVEIQKISPGRDFSLNQAIPQFLAANVAHPDPEDAIDDIRNVHGPTVFKVVSSLVTLPALKVHWRYRRQDCRVCKEEFSVFFDR